MNTVLRTLFGRSASGEPIERITLDNGTLSCSVITYGAILQTLNVPDRNGVPVDIVLGFDTLADYLADKAYIGATVGRFANRIAAGHFRLDGKEYTLATNNGPNHLHGGRRGFSHRIWTISDVSSTHITLSFFAIRTEKGEGDVCGRRISRQSGCQGHLSIGRQRLGDPILGRNRPGYSLQSHQSQLF